jgi:hypothetical protein
LDQGCMIFLLSACETATFLVSLMTADCTM